MLINLIAFVDLSDLAESTYMSLTELALLLKIANFIIRNRNMQNLLVTVQRFQLETDSERYWLQQKINGFFKLLIYYYICVNLSATYSSTSVLFANGQLLPFRAWYPIDWKQNTNYYYAIYVYQVIGMAITSNLNVTIELFPIFLLYAVSVKMEILGKRLECFADIGSVKQRMRNTRAVAGTGSKMHMDSKTEKALLIYLINCIKTHQRIVQ